MRDVGEPKCGSGPIEVRADLSDVTAFVFGESQRLEFGVVLASEVVGSDRQVTACVGVDDPR